MELQKVIIRADASLEIGSGHVMRCLTLAEALVKRGFDVSFVCRDLIGNLAEDIRQRGFACHLLFHEPCDHVNREDNEAFPLHIKWLGVDWEKDATQTLSVLEKKNDCTNLLIVDHYSLDYRWETFLRPYVEKIMVIDDLADRSHNCDILLDQNLYENFENRYNDLVPSHCKMLLGPKYALLRPEFGSARERGKQRDNENKRILVFMGGSDPNNVTERILTTINQLSLSCLDIDIVVGSTNPHVDKLNHFCEGKSRFSLHWQVNNMAELMIEADLAIGAGGTATWERCCLGLPSIGISIASNQEELSVCLAEKGGMLYLGPSETISENILASAIMLLINNNSLSKSMSHTCLNIVDGGGTERVVNLLDEIMIQLRKVTMEDCDVIYQWRNAEVTRRHIFDPQPISLVNHQEWFRESIDNPARVLLIGESEGKPIGVLRYDFEDTEALISIYLTPGNHGRGIGAQLIRVGSRWLRSYMPHIRNVRAEIRAENIASQRAFAKAGYKENYSIFVKDL